MKLFLTVLLPILLTFVFAPKDTEQKALAQSENKGVTAMLGWSADAFAAAGGCCKCCCCCCCKGAAKLRAKRDTACAAARGNAKCMSC